MVVLSTELHVRVWSRQAEELWGLRQEEAVGQHFLNLDIGLPTDRLRSLIRRTLADENGPQETTVRAVDRRGRSIDVRVLGSALRSTPTDVRGIILTMERIENAAELPAARPSRPTVRPPVTDYLENADRLRRRSDEILERINELHERARELAEHRRRRDVSGPGRGPRPCEACAPALPGGTRAVRALPRRGGGPAPARRRPARPARRRRAGPAAPRCGRGGPGGGRYCPDGRRG